MLQLPKKEPLANTNANLFIGKIFKSMTEIEIPDQLQIQMVLLIQILGLIITATIIGTI